MQSIIHSLRKVPAALFAAGLLSAFMPGCAGYHHGSLMHPQIKSIAVGSFQNDTEEAGLTVQLRQKLADFLMNDGSVTVKSEENADAVLRGRIVRYEMSGLGARRVSDSGSGGSNKRDAYQTTIYKTTVTVEYELVIPGMRTPVLDKREATGDAEYSLLSDLNVARDEALRRATQEAAKKIAAGVTEAW